jgi:hypothetical protein
LRHSGLRLCMLCSGMARLSTINTKPIVMSLLIFQPKVSFDVIMHSNVLQKILSIFCPLLSEIPHELISVIEGHVLVSLWLVFIKTLTKNGSDEIMFSRGKINLCGKFGSYGTQAEHPYKADAKIQGCTIMVVLGIYYRECIDSNGDYANLEAYIPASLVGSTIVHVSQYVLHTSNWCSCCHNQQGNNNCCRLAL